MQKNHDEYREKILQLLPCAAVPQPESKLTHNQDAPSGVLQQCQWIIIKVKEKLTQCNDLIQGCNSFDKKYQECLNFIRHGEEVIGKYYSSSTDVETQLEKCSVSDWYHMY